MSGIEMDNLPSAYANTREERVAVSRLVMMRATSREDMRELIDEIGLNGRPMRSTRKIHKPAMGDR